MKGQERNKGQKITPAASQGRRPEIRDNLDHRTGLEQETKGDDVTSNKKDTKEHHLKEKNKKK